MGRASGGSIGGYWGSMGHVGNVSSGKLEFVEISSRPLSGCVLRMLMIWRGE
jgi:hypothetical protein